MVTTALRRVRWEWARRRGGVLVYRLGNDLRLQLHCSSRLARLVFFDYHEAAERRLLSRWLRPGDTFVDVGANFGLYSLEAARRVGRAGRVFAFEPAAVPYAQLVANVSLNRLSSVTCMKLALSDRRGLARMAVSSDGLDAWNSLGVPAAAGNYGEETVEAIDWDSFAEDRGLVGSVAMMKIDVEGWEEHAIAGALRTLARSDAPVLQVEFNDDAARAAGSSCHRLYQALVDLGFDVFTLDGKTEMLVPLALRDTFPSMNVFAVKPGR